MSLHDLVEVARNLERSVSAMPDRRRTLLGIAGPPAAGKSRLAEAVAAELNREEEASYACVVPLDGFHFRNAVLDSGGLRAVKGAPDTFDVAAYTAKLAELREDGSKAVFCPAFDRHGTEESVADAIIVPPSTRIVLTEGNYLILDIVPWDTVRGLLDQVWFLNVDIDEAEARLLARHRKSGNDEPTVLRRVYGNDLVNFKVVEGTAANADLVIDPSELESL